MNVVLGHLPAYIGLTGPGEALEDGRMNEIKLPSTHTIWNSYHGGLRLNTIPVVKEIPYNTEYLRVSGEETFVSLKLNARAAGDEPAISDFTSRQL